MIVAEDRNAQEQCFCGGNPEAFFGQIDESFRLCHDFVHLWFVVESIDEDDIPLRYRFQLFFIRSGTYDDERIFGMIEELDDLVDLFDEFHQSAGIDEIRLQISGGRWQILHMYLWIFGLGVQAIDLFRQLRCIITIRIDFIELCEFFIPFPQARSGPFEKPSFPPFQLMCIFSVMAPDILHRGMQI